MNGATPTAHGPVHPSPTTGRPRKRRGGDRRGRYVLAALVALIGTAAAVLWAVTGFSDQVQRPEDFARTQVPGSTTVTITQTGEHVIYAEGTGPVAFETADVTVVDPQGAPVEVRSYALDLRYDVPGAPGQLGTAVAVFDAERTGAYQVGTEALPGGGTDKLAVGDDLAPDLIRSVAGPGSLAILLVLGCSGFALATWIQDARKE